MLENKSLNIFPTSYNWFYRSIPGSSLILHVHHWNRKLLLINHQSFSFIMGRRLILRIIFKKYTRKHTEHNEVLGALKNNNNKTENLGSRFSVYNFTLSQLNEIYIYKAACYCVRIRKKVNATSCERSEQLEWGAACRPEILVLHKLGCHRKMK